MILEIRWLMGPFVVATLRCVLYNMPWFGTLEHTPYKHRPMVSLWKGGKRTKIIDDDGFS